MVRRDAQCKQLLVPVLSALSREADVRRACVLGANSHVVKPSRFNDLVSLVAARPLRHRFLALPPQSDRRRGPASPR